MIKVVLIGAGKLANQLGPAIASSRQATIIQVYNRNLLKASKLAVKCSSTAVDDLNYIDQRADVYIIAISDSAIGVFGAILRQYLPEDTLVVHTSGATPSTVLVSYFRRYGVFYPLQTFALDKTANFEEIPILVDAKDKSDLKFLEKLGKFISQKVQVTSDDERARLHLAAVFACNFTNHNYAIAKALLADQGISFDLLRPLILETARMVQDNAPDEVQTGPAIRGDESTLYRHLVQLEGNQSLQELYKLMSNRIRESGE